MSDVCLFCGAKEFACGTYEAHTTIGGKLEPYWDRTHRCKDWEIAALKHDMVTLKYGANKLIEQNEKLHQILDAWREFGRAMNYFEGGEAQHDRLVELTEIESQYTRGEVSPAPPE